MDLARHIQIFWTELASPPALPGEEDEESSPQASDHIPVPPPVTPHLFSPITSGDVCEQKGRDTPLAKAVREFSKKSVSLVPAEAWTMSRFGPDHTLEPTSKNGGAYLVGHREVESNQLHWEQRPRSRCIKAPARCSSHSSRNHAPREDPSTRPGERPRSLCLPGEEHGAQSPCRTAKDPLSC